MSDPGRLFDETESELERRLLGVGRSERSSPEARARTLAALGITGSAALLTTSAAAASGAAPAAALGKLSWKLSWVKVVAGLSALGAVAAVPPAYRAWQHRHPAVVASTASVVAVPTPVTMPAPPTETAATATATATTAESPVAASGPPPKTAAAPAIARRSLAPATGSRAAVDPTTLTRELGALDTIRATLARGEPARALALLDTYARGYPRGRLAPEAEILRIDALARTGHAAGARQRAAAFVQRHPNSVLAARARRYLDD